MQIADMLFLDTDGLPKPARVTALPKHEDIHDLGRLLSDQELPNHLCKVWYGITDVETLDHFFASDIYWGEVDVLSLSATRGSLTPSSGLKPTRREEHCSLRDLLWCFEQQGRGIRLDIKKAPQQNLWVVFYLIDPMELRASEENNDSDASPTGSGCGYM
ncbi:MAG: hypothetical protein ACREYE_06420, partial [Gammaproteobacteria bacterium]